MKHILILLLSLAFVGCSDSSGGGKIISGTNNITVQISNKNPGKGGISVLGDSLAAGYKATDINVKPASCLSRLPNREVVDYAIPGLTSAQILSRVNAVTAQIPNLVFVSSGGNDTLSDHYQPGSYPVQKTYAEMSEMFDRLIASGALVVYLGLDPQQAGAERLPEISKIATSKGVIVVDGMNGFWNDSSLMADTVHPNNKGYSIMCDRILTALQGYYP